MEDNALFENEFEESAAEIDSEENGEGLSEVRQGTEEMFNETEHEVISVSSGDSVSYDDELLLLVNEIIEDKEEEASLQEMIEYDNQNIFEKPLADYTVTESLLVILLFLMLFGVLIKLIGGIITCKV